MIFTLEDAGAGWLDAAADFYEEHGYLRVGGAAVPGGVPSMLACFKPLLARLLGPLVHVFPPASATTGLLRQSFFSSARPISPGGLTLWLPDARTGDRIRLYPGSHRLGFLCHGQVEADDRRLGRLGEPLDLPVGDSTALLCHNLLVHGAHGLRFSCYPLSGFVRLKVESLDWFPAAALLAGLARSAGPVLRVPLLEAQVWLAGQVRLPRPPRLSLLHWVRYLARGLKGDEKGSRLALQHLLNRELAFDPPQAFWRSFDEFVVHSRMLASARRRWRVQASPAA